MDLNKMTLDEFIEQERKSLDKFVAYWRREMKKDSDSYPATLAYSEWWEQLFSFTTK